METEDVKHASKPAWSHTAFMVEALFLLAFLIAAMAVVTQLFAGAAAQAREADHITQATVLAQSAAEEFSSNPQAVAKGAAVGQGVAAGESTKDDLQVACTVDADKQTAGTFYTAHITVSDDTSEIYALDASRYVSGVK